MLKLSHLASLFTFLSCHISPYHRPLLLYCWTAAATCCPKQRITSSTHRGQPTYYLATNNNIWILLPSNLLEGNRGRGRRRGTTPKEIQIPLFRWLLAFCHWHSLTVFFWAAEPLEWLDFDWKTVTISIWGLTCGEEEFSHEQVDGWMDGQTTSLCKCAATGTIPRSTTKF